MSWNIYGERLLTTDFSGTAPRVFQKVRFNSDALVKAVRTWIIIYGSPVFTELQMRVYANNDGTPSDLIHTFDKVWTLAELTSQPYAAREIYFDFDLARQFKDLDYYYFGLWATGYTASGASHLAWRRTTNDNANADDIVVDSANLNEAPYHLGFIWDHP